MSIAIKISELNDEQKQLIIDSEFSYIKNKKSGNITIIQPYYIDEITKIVYIPFYFCINKLNIKPPPRDRYLSTSILFTGELRDYQEEIIPTIKKALNINNCALLSLYTGFGKTIIAIYLSTILKFKTLIVVNKLVLVNQWIEAINEFTNGKVQFIKPTMSKKEPLLYDRDFYIINAMNITKLRDIIKELSIGFVIVDELHLICAEQLFKNMYHISPRYILSLSATPYRSDGLDNIIKLYFGETTITIKLYRPHIVYKVQTNIDLDYKYQLDGSINWNSLLSSQATHIKRNDMIIDIILKYSTRNFLVLCKRVIQGIYLVDKLEKLREKVTHMFDNNKNSYDTNCRILIATGQKAGTGFSHNKMNTLILAADIEEYFIQYLGRVFRTQDVEPYIFDFVDNHKTLQKHFNTRKQVYLDAGGVIKQYNIYKP